MPCTANLLLVADTAIHYDAQTIEALLDREQEGGIEDSTDVPGSVNLMANEYLSSFKVASYVTKEVDEVSDVLAFIATPLSYPSSPCRCARCHAIGGARRD